MAAVEISTLISDALAAVDDDSVSTASLLRRSIRIASLRNDNANLVWLEIEMYGISGRPPAETSQRNRELAVGVDADGWAAVVTGGLEPLMRRRTSQDGKMVYSDSVSELENRVRLIEVQRDMLDPPQGLAPLDLYHRSKASDEQKMQLTLAVLGFTNVLAKIRDALHAFLVTSEKQVHFGQANADIFERNRRFVDEQIGNINAEVLDQFKSAYSRLQAEGDAEAKSHALLSCRRILKTLADTVYPARPGRVLCADGVEREMNDARYINRLVQFVSEVMGSHGSAQVTKTTLDSLGARLSALDGLDSKGVHASVTAEEVDACIIQTYMMVGEVLRYKAGRAVSDADLDLPNETVTAAT